MLTKVYNIELAVMCKEDEQTQEIYTKKDF